MLHLVLAEAEIEMVPEMLWTHKQVSAAAKRLGTRPSKLVLDSSDHHAALKFVPQGNRRGRPDLLHLWLLTVLESRANHKGLIQPWVHTRNDEWVRVDPQTRMVRHYPRFLHLLRQLLTEGRVGPKGKDLLHLTPNVSLKEGLAKLPEPRFVLDAEAKEHMAPSRLATKLGLEATLVMGGFPHGGFNQQDALEGATKLAFPGDETLAVWTVIGEVMAQLAALHVDGQV